MARADQLKKLFSSYRSQNNRAFLEVAEDIIDDERRKHHPVLADELEKILGISPSGSKLSGTVAHYEDVPRDSERGTPLLEIRHPDRYLDSLVLASEVRRSVDRVIQEYTHWYVLEANGLCPAQNLLFCGPPGCGKTSAAEAVASELSLPLLYVRFDSVVSSLLGETASNLRRVFDYAIRGNWVVLFDEFDAIGRSRDDSSEHGEIKRVVNSYLQLIDNFRGKSLLISSTNFEGALDPAIWRRFDEVIRFPKPTIADIEGAIELYLGALEHDARSANSLAKALQGSAFSDIERVCLDIRKSAALQGAMRAGSDHFAYALARWEVRRNAMEPALNSIPSLVDRD